MLLKTKLGTDYVDENIHDNPTYYSDGERAAAIEAYERGWDDALQWAARNDEQENKLIVSKASIIKGITKRFS